MIIANMFRWKYTLISISAVFILYIIHFSNIAYSIPVSERTEQVQEEIKRALDIDEVSQITDAHLARITALNLKNKDIHSLKSGDFEGLSGLKNLNLFGNNLDVLPNSIFSGLKSLTVLRLGGNNTYPLQTPIKLEKISDGEFRAVVITAAPFDIELDINIVNGTTKNSKITVNKGSTYSSILNVERIYGTTDIVTAEIKVLPQLPKFHYGYIFVKSNRSPINVIDKVEVIIDKTPDDNVVDEVIEEDEVQDDSLDNQEPEIETSEVQNDITNNPPYFGTNNIFVRYIEENVIAGINVGMPITAIDQDPNDTLIYSLDGLDQESFSIDSKSGQILTKLPLDYESKNLYIVRVVVSDYKDKNWVYVVIKLIDKNDGRTNFVEDFLDINERTPAVQDAIISAIPNIDNAENITVDHLESITELNLRGAGITQLKSGDFSGLHGLTNLNLYGNMLRRLPEDIFNGLISLKSLRLGRNIFDPLPILVSFQKIEFDKYQVVIPTGAPFDINMLVNNNTSIDTVRIKKGDTRSNVFTSKGIPKIEQLPTLPRNHFGYTISQSTVCHRSEQVIKGITNSLGQPDCRLISDLDLLLIRDLDLSGMSIESLKSFDFSGLLMLNHIDLSNNKLSKLPEGIFDKLTRIQSLNLHNNRFDPLPITFLLEKVGKDQIKITIPVCAPSEMNIPVSVKVGEIVSNKFIVQISTGNYESDLYTITRPDDTLDYIYVDIVDPIDIPNTHSGYTFIGNTNTPLEIFERINVAPVFVEGEKTNRNIAENTDSGENIGIPITATDINNDKLNYTITGQDAQSFSIDNSNGQIITKSPLDYETKSEYSIIVNVSDGILTTSIIVAIKIDDVYENIYPVFVEGENTTRNIAENTDIGIGINAIKATDANENDTLEYTLSGTDASRFKIDSASGQLITNSQLDFETKSSYSIIVHASDNNGGTDSITVKIIVNDVNEAPVFISDLSTRITIDENITTRTNIGKFTATDEDKDDILKWTITGEEAQYFHIISTTGQLQTKSPLDYETKSLYTFDVNVYDNHGLSDTISVDIEISDIDENTAPEFIEGETVSRYIAENSNAGIDIGSPITARDSEQDSLVYTIQGTDANTFDIISTTGQLKTKDSLDYEFKNSYSVQVIVSDGKLTDTITVTIYINDVFEIVDIEPDIPETTQPDIPETTQPDTSENTQPDTPENTQPDTSENTQPDIPETIEPQTPQNNAPYFISGIPTSRSINENVPIGTNIGNPITAKDDDDGDKLTYSLINSSAAPFEIDATSGQIKTSTNVDHENKNSYTITVQVSDSKLTDTIAITINIIDVNEAPVFNAGNTATRSVLANTDSITNIGSAFSVSDDDGDALTWTLSGTDASSFSIDDKGQLKTKDNIDYSLKQSYAITITVSDGTLTDTIKVTINTIDTNEAPVFASDTTTLEIAENTASGVNIGSPITATDADNDTLTYTLSGTDAAAFSIQSTSGQIKTKESTDHETKDTYEVIITASDGNKSDTITVTIEIKDVNEAPVFTDSSDITREVNENTAPNEDIGDSIDISATDPDDGDTLTWTLGGTDAASFNSEIDSDSDTLQLKTVSALDYETKNSYSLKIIVSDSDGLEDDISVTININDVYEAPPNSAPVFTDGANTERSIAENTASGVNIGSPITATDANNDTLTWTLRGTDAAAFSIQSTSGQIKTKAALDFETKTTYTIIVNVSDEKGGTDSITVTIKITDVNENPGFLEESVTYSLNENTASGKNIGKPSVNNPNKDNLIFELKGDGSNAFDIVSNTGQLRTKDIFNYESDPTSYSFQIDCKLGENTIDTIDITVNIRDINEPPKFNINAKGLSKEFTISEKLLFPTISNTIAIIDATDEDAIDNEEYTRHNMRYSNRLKYKIASSNSNLFTIEQSTITFTGINVSKTGGQLYLYYSSDEEKYDTEKTYKLKIIVEDSKLARDSIDITVKVKKNSPPSFVDGDSTTREVSATANLGTFVGEPISATDPDGDKLEYKFVYLIPGTQHEGLAPNIHNFTINSETGQISLVTNKVLQSYVVTVNVTDGKARDRIDVTINPISSSNAPSNNIEPFRLIPTSTELLPNYPNPFNPETWIPYQLSESSHVELTIYDIKGAIIRHIDIGHKMPGTYIDKINAIHWDGSNNRGERISSGIYFYTLKAGKYTKSRSLLILK